jgi:hypothetical protein
VYLPAMTEKLNVGGEAGRNRAATTETAFWNISLESPAPYKTQFNRKNWHKLRIGFVPAEPAKARASYNKWENTYYNSGRTSQRTQFVSMTTTDRLELLRKK